MCRNPKCRSLFSIIFISESLARFPSGYNCSKRFTLKECNAILTFVIVIIQVEFNFLEILGLSEYSRFPVISKF